MKSKEIIYRKAEIDDLEQLIDLTIQSFYGYNGRSFLESVFNISNDDYRDIVKSLFESGVSHNEYDLNSYYVLEYENKLISCLAGWKEGVEGIESERLLSRMVLKFVGVEQWQARKKVIEKASSLNLARVEGAIQIENMFLQKEFRGTSAFFKIYYRTVDNLFKKYPDCNIIQSRFFQSNRLAIRIAEHIGYKIKATSSFNVDPIKRYFPNEGLVMTELEKDIFYSNNKIKSRLNG